MLYVQLDTNWPDDPKIIRAGWEAAGVHAAIMCLAKRLEDDGWVDIVILERMGVAGAVIDRLVDLELLTIDGERVRPGGWLNRNPSQAAIAARRDAKARAGKKGNHDRWLHPDPFDICAVCHPEAQVVAPCESDRIAEHRTPTKSKSEVGIRTPLEEDATPDTIDPEQVDHIRELKQQFRPYLVEANELERAVSGSPLSERGMHA